MATLARLTSSAWLVCCAGWLPGAEPPTWNDAKPPVEARADGLAAGDVAAAAASQPVSYNRDVLPILAERCFTCHGFDEGTRAAGLRLDNELDSRQVLPSNVRAIVPGSLDDSALWKRVNAKEPSERMPPPEAGAELSDAELLIVKRWIAQGGDYELHWAFVPPVAALTAQHPSTGSQPIDAFIHQRLREQGLAPAPPADRSTLIRRVTLDLIGLPPTLMQVREFVADARPDAYPQLVERLLASPHFGERWARWWLDLAHYGDSDGYLQDFLRPVAWRYRQWVVDALNADYPFDEFTIDQLAGDQRPAATMAQRLGTGFLRNTLSNREGGADLEEFRVNQVLDRTNTVGTTWLALTIACAQCHDHKFDAITQREYYQLYAFFNSADEANIDAPLPEEIELWQQAKPVYDQQRAKLLAPVVEELARLQTQWEAKILYTEAHPGEDFSWDRTLELLGLQWGQNLGEGQLEGLGIIKTPLAERSGDQQRRLQDYFLRAAPAEFTADFQRLQVSNLIKQLDELARQLPPLTRGPAMIDSPAQREHYIFERGQYLRRGPGVSPATLSALPPLPVGEPTTRLTLAKWLVSPQHPLTSRVVVNRLWQELFGRGLVTTSDNFGVRGQLPTHPELLDWLAVDLVRRQWSLKAMLRQLVLSDTYQQSSAVDDHLTLVDSENRWFARQERLRLSAEAIRDASLSVSGLLNGRIGGPSVKPPQPVSVSREGYANHWDVSPLDDRYRRGLYTFIQRTSPFAQFVAFDLPDASRSCTRRQRTNTPLQALHLLNDPSFVEAALALGWQMELAAAGDDQRGLQFGMEQVLGRVADAQELARLQQFLIRQRRLQTTELSRPERRLETGPLVRDPAWISTASILLNLDEFLNRE